MKETAKYIMVGIAVLAMTGCVTTNKPLKEARAAYDSGQYMEASAKAKEALALDDRSAEALYIRGMAAVQLKDYLMGRELLEKASGYYKSDSDTGMKIKRQLALANFYLEDLDAAENAFNEYMAIKEENGRLLLEEDYYWAGVIADVSMKDSLRDEYWSKLSSEFKKSKGIK